jgi:hypothetical protein
MIWDLANGWYVPKAPIARAYINDCYLEAAIKISTTNAYFVPIAAIQKVLP